MSLVTTVATNEALEPQKQDTQATPEVPKPETKDINFSERFNELAKKEKNRLRRENEYKLKERTLSEREARTKTQEDNITKFEELKRSRPLEALKLLGLDYNELTQTVLNAENPTPEYQIKGVKEELEELKRAQELDAKQRLEAQKKASEEELKEVVTQFKDSIGEYVTGKADDYELINLFDQSQLVYDTIEAYFNTNQKTLSIKEGADLVEKYLEEQVKKTTATKKFSKIYSPPKPEATAPKKEANSFHTQQPRTLSNNITSSAPTYLPAKSEQERISRALAALDKK